MAAAAALHEHAAQRAVGCRPPCAYTTVLPPPNVLNLPALTGANWPARSASLRISSMRPVAAGATCSESTANSAASTAVKPITGTNTDREPAPQACAAVISLSWYSRPSASTMASSSADGNDQREVLNRAEQDELEHHAARKLALGRAL